MKRIYVYPLIIIAILGLSGGFLYLSSVPEKSLTSDNDMQNRVSATTALVFNTIMADLKSQLAVQAFNGYLVAGLEELDGYTAMKALQGICIDGKLDDCRVYDIDGEFLADKDIHDSEGTISYQESKTRNAAGTETPAAGLVVRGSDLWIISAGPVPGLDGRSGFLKLGKKIDRGVCLALAKASGLLVSLFSPAGGLICTSASGEEASALAQIFSSKKAVAGDSFEVGSSPHSIFGISIGGGLGSDLILVSAEKIGVRSSGGSLDRRLLGAVLAFVLISMLIFLSTVLTSFRRPLQGLLPEIAAVNFSALHPPGSLTVTGPPEIEAVATRMNQLISSAFETITNLRKDRAATESRVAKVAELIRVSEGAFSIFLAKTRGFIENCKNALAILEGGGEGRDVAADLMRLTHTIKSNAKLFNLRHVNDIAKELEEFLASVLQHPNPDRSFGKMAESYVDLIAREVEGYQELRLRIFPNHEEEDTHDRELLRSTWLVSITNRVFSWLKNPERDPVVAGKLQSEFFGAVSSFGKEDLKEYAGRYNRMLAEMAKSDGKKVHPLEITGNYRHFSHKTMQQLNDVFLHCLRNAFDHGIESVTRRESIGKAAAGILSIDSNFYSGICSVVIRDDGKGIDLEALRRKAIESQGYTISESKTLTEQQLLELVFKTGFSTARYVTDISGRGVGMDVVRNVINEMGGEVWIESIAGKGTSVHMHFPIPDARHDSRLGLFNPVPELKLIVAALARYTRNVNIQVKSPLFVQQRALVVCDRFLFGEAVRAMVLEAATSGADTITFELSYEDSPGACNLESFVLKLTILGGPVDAPAIDMGFESHLFSMLAEAGIILNDERANNGVWEFKLSGGANAWFDNRKIQVYVPAVLTESLGELFKSVAAARFASVIVEMVAYDRLDSTVTLANDAVVVLDEEILANDLCFAGLKKQRPSSVIMVAENIDNLNRERLFSLSHEPMIVEGILDADGAASAIEFCLVRKLSRLSHAETSLLTLGVA